MKGNELMGTWVFKSMVLRSDNGKMVYPYGENLFGILIYTPGGYMSALLMDPERQPFASDDLKTGTADEIKQAYERFDAYCGTYTVDEEKSIVTHHVKGAKFPNWVGTDQVRHCDLKGDRLYISATLKVAGENWLGEAVLERL
ncbi:MAG: lipocalin-like domain-containing protein [candidate division WOR-3 bacterium]|nr:MAG: lipocalin-like domain-containing protein [candidate division WOR-3 bacterium]